MLSALHTNQRFCASRASYPECHITLRPLYRVNIRRSWRHGRPMLCNALISMQRAPAVLFPSLLLPPFPPFPLSPFLPSNNSTSHVENDFFCFSRSNHSRRFRRQDVRHGNAVQLCNGLQIDGWCIKQLCVCVCACACVCLGTTAHFTGVLFSKTQACRLD